MTSARRRNSGEFLTMTELCKVIICFNNDVGDFWEYIDSPHYKLRPTAEALRLGVNFVLYAMTH